MVQARILRYVAAVAPTSSRSGKGMLRQQHAYITGANEWEYLTQSLDIRSFTSNFCPQKPAAKLFVQSPRAYHHESISSVFRTGKYGFPILETLLAFAMPKLSPKISNLGSFWVDVIETISYYKATTRAARGNGFHRKTILAISVTW
jgi:hypothetical protein